MGINYQDQNLGNQNKSLLTFVLLISGEQGVEHGDSYLKDQDVLGHYDLLDTLMLKLSIKFVESQRRFGPLGCGQHLTLTISIKSGWIVGRLPRPKQMHRKLQDIYFLIRSNQFAYGQLQVSVTTKEEAKKNITFVSLTKILV